MSYESVKDMQKRVNKKVMNYIPDEAKDYIVIGAVGVHAATSGEISTRQIKNTNIKFLNGNLKPEVIYNFKENKMDARVQLDWSF